MLKALPGFALIELPKKYESGLTEAKEKYAIRSEGVLRDVVVANDGSDQLIIELSEIYGEALDKTVYFAAFEDGEVVKHENKEYVFVPVKSLRGVKQDAEA